MTTRPHVGHLLRQLLPLVTLMCVSGTILTSGQGQTPSSSRAPLVNSKQGQSSKPAAPASPAAPPATPPPAFTGPVPPPVPEAIPQPPLTAAQQALLKGTMAGFVARLAKSTGIRLVPVPAGTFTMGDSADVIASPPHPVTLSKYFLLSATVLTQAQHRAVLPPSANPPYQPYQKNKNTDNLPYAFSTRAEAVGFCQRLNKLELQEGSWPTTRRRARRVVRHPDPFGRFRIMRDVASPG